MSQPATHSSFEFLRRQAVKSLNLVVEEYRHRVTGAQHIHLASDSPENVFLVALRTVPEDSTGVAHILEHTALCGSEKYPVRDPFFMMIRRSLNTFMNAMTSSDWTAYPFASLNRKDYFNLLDVYLDAVFFSRLDPLDFAQEGHRLEFAEPGNPDSPLVYKGVVFNEMKGAMSSPVSTLWHGLGKYLYPTTTYRHNSGGDPECIPDLTYQQLRHFYETHYHPSNAIFMTFGDIPAATIQERIETQALSRFQRLDVEISVPDEKRYLAPVRVEEAYAFDEDAPSDNKTHIVIGWLLGASTNLLESMEAHLLSSVLLDNSASPLLQALETTDLGNSPSPLCGLDDSQKELCFVCGIEGSEPDRARELERLVLDVLERVAREGIPEEQVAASLHQLELQQREITGDSYPFGLQLLMTALTSATHRGDPIALLDLDPVLETLRQRITDPEYIKDLARRLLLENQHRVTLVLRPDPELSARRVKAEMERLAAIKAGLDDAARQAIIEQAEALKERQARKDDDSILPKVGLDDIPRETPYATPVEKLSSPLPLTNYAVGTNGLVYQQVILRLPPLADEEVELLPLYSGVLTELGVGERDYLATQLWQSRVSGSLTASVGARGTPSDSEALAAHLVLSGKGLARNQQELTQLMAETLDRVRFDELDRIRDLVAQRRARREASVTGQGHSLAMLAAASGLGAASQLAHRWGGLAGISALKALDKSLDDSAQLSAFAARLQALHDKLRSAPRQYLLVGEAERLADYKAALVSGFPEGTWPQTLDPFVVATAAAPTRTAWKTSTQVNFCANAYPTVSSAHPDAAALTVLGGFLRNGYLHTAIREQGGAYGGGASQDNHAAAFRFFSYRDPRLEETLADFDSALDWLQRDDHGWQPVEEAILGVIASLDKPASPAGEAKQAFHSELYGGTRELREAFRNRVLAVTLADLQRVAAEYLTPQRRHSAVITSPTRAGELAETGYEVFSL